MFRVTRVIQIRNVPPIYFSWPGFMMAIALENCNLHRRLSLATLRIMGTSTPLVMLAVMLPTWFLSASVKLTTT